MVVKHKQQKKAGTFLFSYKLPKKLLADKGRKRIDVFNAHYLLTFQVKQALSKYLVGFPISLVSIQ